MKLFTLNLIVMLFFIANTIIFREVIFALAILFTVILLPFSYKAGSVVTTRTPYGHKRPE